MTISILTSYFIFPAWQAFAERTHLIARRKLQSDGQTLLVKWHGAKPSPYRLGCAES